MTVSLIAGYSTTGYATQDSMCKSVSPSSSRPSYSLQLSRIEHRICMNALTKIGERGGGVRDSARHLHCKSRFNCISIRWRDSTANIGTHRFAGDQFSRGGTDGTLDSTQHSADECLEHIAPASVPCSHNTRSNKKAWLNKMENSITRAVTPRFATSS